MTSMDQRRSSTDMSPLFIPVAVGASSQPPSQFAPVGAALLLEAFDLGFEVSDDRLLAVDLASELGDGIGEFLPKNSPDFDLDSFRRRQAEP